MGRIESGVGYGLVSFKKKISLGSLLIRHQKEGYDLGGGLFGGGGGG